MVLTVEEQLAEAQSAIQNLTTRLGELSTARSASPRVDASRVPKLPPLFREDPTFWFSQIEGAFRSAGVTTEQTKADYVLQVLNYEEGQSIRELALDPNIENRYTKIKERLIGAFSASSETRLRQLLKGQILTDGKPSFILQRIRNLNSEKFVDEAVVKSIFLDHLPSTIRGILVSNTYDSLEKCAEAADLATEIMNASPQYVSAASTAALGAPSTAALGAPLTVEINAASSAPPNETQATLQKVLSSLTTLTSKVGALEKRVQANVNKSNPPRGRSTSRGRTDICWVHKKFGEKAYSCRGTSTYPCNWSDNQNSEN